MGKGLPTARELAPGSEWDVSEKEWAVFKNVMSTRDKTQVKAVFCRATMRLWLWIRQQLREEGCPDVLSSRRGFLAPTGGKPRYEELHVC